MSPEFLKALGKEFNFSPPRKHGFDTVRTIEAMQQGTSQGLRRPRRQLPLGDARYEVHRRSARSVPTDRADVDQAEPRPSRHRRAGADPPLPRPHGTRPCRAGGEQFVSVEDTMGVVHSRAACSAGVGASAQRAGDRLPASRRPRSESGPTVDWQSLVDELRPASASTSSTSCPASRSTTRGCASRAASICRTPRTRGSSRRRPRRAKFTVHPIPRSRPGRRATAADDHPQPRPVQHHDLRRERPVPRHRTAAPRDSSERRRHAPRWASQRDQWVDLTSHFEGERGAPSASRSFPTIFRAAARRPIFRRPTCWCRCGSVADGSNQPASKSIVISWRRRRRHYRGTRLSPVADLCSKEIDHVARPSIEPTPR